MGEDVEGQKEADKLRFRVTLQVEMMVVLDPALVEAVTRKEWRKQFYPLETAEDVAQHVAFNYARNQIEDVSRLDGFADRSAAEVEVCEVEWESLDVREER